MQAEIQESDCFEFNRSEVAVKVIDGEAVAIDVISGKYHGTTGTACGIMHLMGLGVSLGQIADAVEARYPDAKGRIREDLRTFAGQLLEQRIVLRAREPGPTAGATVEFDDATYAAPRLETYDDMAELLALDPPMPTVLDTPWAGEMWSRPNSDVSGLSHERH
jgi:hypothetical protein